MTATFIDGTKIAEEINAEAAAEVNALRERGIRPGLAVILVVDDAASSAYVNMKARTCEQLGINSRKVTLPGSIDVFSARRIGEELASVLASGTTTVIADMTATAFCDSSGARTLVAACQQAAANNIEMRLVVPYTFVLRALALMGLGRLPVYRTLDGALAHGDHDRGRGRH